jgi:hypothetical protein
LNSDFSTDVHAVRDYTETIARMLKEEKFEEIDCLADRARSNKEGFPGGMWKLDESTFSASSNRPIVSAPLLLSGKSVKAAMVGRSAPICVSWRTTA